ncbi:uncharacterized protein LOC131690611 [Topomyia yanbarensis]|uniref:uncharacterized protein LOC131690611 n=1 Tax=Topomyia yanbarensis TaxID=2498891 RepID=UPI00273C0D92|nr:uncharacterized protein LOC131690611 [Topomyia yanbarensis]
MNTDDSLPPDSDPEIEECLNRINYSREDLLVDDDSLGAVLSTEMIEYSLSLSDTGMDISKAENVDHQQSESRFSQNKLPEGLLGCWLLIAVRDFKGHSSGKEVGKWGVSGNTAEQFTHSCWLLAKNFLKREVIFTCDERGVAMPVWSSKPIPEEGDFIRFALFNDKTNHRCYTVDKVTPTLLQNWRNKEIHLLLHVYSLSVNNKSVFKTVREVLLEPEERDKAGAASNQSVAVLAQKLRDIHGDKWEAKDIAWMMWANAIYTSEFHCQERLLHDAPPAHLVKLFSVKEQPRLKAIRRGFAVAHSVNAGYHDDVESLREAFEDMQLTAQNMIVKMQSVKRHLEALEQRDRIGDTFISAAEEASGGNRLWSIFSQSRRGDG